MKFRFPSSLVFALLAIATLLAGVRGEQPIDLGLAEPYAILAGTTVTSTGTLGTKVIGDIGIFPGSAITGFPPAVLNGTLDSGNGASEDAQGALTIAYNTLAGKIFNSTLSSQDLGGMTLLSSVYKFDATAEINGVLTLDAAGDASAVWVFQIGTSLTVAAGSSIVFKDGVGNPDYVYWQVGSSVTLASGVPMVGNILALASITVNSGTVVTGRCLALNGGVTLDNSVISIPVKQSTTVTSIPSEDPSMFPSPLARADPTVSPVAAPSEEPTADPTVTHSAYPSEEPTARPTEIPSEAPTAAPSTAPSATPSMNPSINPTLIPSPTLSTAPSANPSISPSINPTLVPSAAPSTAPSATPSVSPSINPTLVPSAAPSTAPSATPSKNPSVNPTLIPSAAPSTAPSATPSMNPSVNPTLVPSAAPSTAPSATPSMNPSVNPTLVPSAAPSTAPSATPSKSPSVNPTLVPCAAPSATPSMNPSVNPTLIPSAAPSTAPSTAPSATPSMNPSVNPTLVPSAAPSTAPSATPSMNPSVNPTLVPSAAPSTAPSATPSKNPSVSPTLIPSASLSVAPSVAPSATPSKNPSVNPSAQPTLSATAASTFLRTSVPTADAFVAPSVEPTASPSDLFESPSVEPSAAPTTIPSILLSLHPTVAPSEVSNKIPSVSPSSDVSFPPSPSQNGTAGGPNVTPTTAPSKSANVPSVISSVPSPTPSRTPSDVPDTGSSRAPSLHYNDTTAAPSAAPTTTSSSNQNGPTATPNSVSTTAPSRSVSVPSAAPVDSPHVPSVAPHASPTVGPSVASKDVPSAAPFLAPTTTTAPTVPSVVPSHTPSTNSSAAPTVAPTKIVSSNAPSAKPSAVPSVTPSAMPSVQPSVVPTVIPTVSYPTFSAPIRVMAARTSVAVTVSVTRQSTIYCAALPVGTDPSTVVDIKNAGTRYIAAKEGTFSFDLNGLTPSFDYKLYCYTESFAGVPMPLAIAFPYAVQFSTLCCRSIEFSKTHSRIAQYVPTSTRAEQPFAFFLDSRPTAAVSISVALNLVACSETAPIESTITDTVMQPSRFQFHPNSTVLSGSFLVRGTTLGCYMLSVSDSGKTYASATTRFEMTGSASAPAVPVLTKVALSDAGTAVLFTFDSATDRGDQHITAFASTFSCSLIVTFPGSAQSTCKWLNSSQLSASIVATQTQVQVGSSASVLADVVRAACVPSTDCKVYEYMAASSLTVGAPENALRPVASLSAPNAISFCSDITLDPTLSTGFGGRDWAEVLWVVSGSAIAQNTAAMAAYLNANHRNTFDVATVPNSFLTRSTATDEAIYTISLKLTNFLQQRAVTSVSVRVNAETSAVTPTIALSGFDPVTYRWKPLSLFASVTWPRCASNATRARPIQFDWMLYRGSTLLRSASSSRDKRYFKLPGYTLDASEAYLVVVTASVVTNGMTVSASASAALQTGVSGVSAVISGASSRTGSALTNIVVDASLSKDIDYPESTAALTYVWSCVVVAPAFGSPCNGFVSKNTPKYTIPAGSLAAQVYEIGVTVTNAASGTSATSIELTVVGSALPSLLFTQTKTKYNPDEKIALSATIGATSGNVFAQWSSSSLTSIKALTPLTRVFQAGSSYTYQFALAGTTLTAGLTYTFQLSARYTNVQQAAISSVSIVINAPPASGALAIDPPSGTGLITPFTFSTSRWTDDAEDLPLLYVLAYYALKESNQNIIKARDAISYKTAKIGQGLLKNNFIVVGIATASDNLGSSASATNTITVNPPANAEVVLNSTLAALDFALLDSNPNGVQQAVDGALSSVNVVNCTVPTPCSSLNREICSETARTCGPCLAGYFGPTGDANVACLAAASGQRRLLAGNDSTPKSCPGDCSGQGTCVFTDLYEQSIEVCTVSEPNCRARCECDAGFYGKSCSLTLTDYEQMMSLREKLCTSMYATVGLQDVTPDVVRARGLSISNILVDINQISDTALGNCTAALVETVVAFPALSCQGNAAALISKALSNVLEMGRRLPEDLLESVNTALTALASGCQSALSVGEEPTVITTNNVNILATVSDRDALANLTLQAPQTEFDTYNGIAASTVSVNATSISGFGTVGVTVYRYTNNPNGQVTNSSQISVQTTAEDSASLPGLILVLQNNEPIDYEISDPPSVISIRCFEYESFEYIRNVTCGNGLVVNLTCPAYAKGTYNVTCPGRVRTPQCKTFDGTAFVVNPLCSVLSFDAYSTTCYCAGSTARRFLQSGESTATQYGTAFVDIGTNFGTTFASAPSLTDVQNNLVILSTLAGIVGLWIVGTFVFLRWDKQDAERVAHNELVESKKKTKVRLAFQFFNSIFPDELRAGSWYVIFMYQMRREHFLIRLFTTNDQDKSLRSVFWATAMCKFAAFLFMNCLVASTMYPDDGYCEGFQEAGACNDAKSIGGLFNSCHWRPENASCEFNPPNTDFITSIIITLIVTMLTIPLEYIMEGNIKLWAQYFHYTELERKIAIDDTPAEGAQLRKYDEFTRAQGFLSTIWRAARLEKSRQQIDFVHPEEEARLVEVYAKEVTAREKKDVFSSVLQQISLKKYRYSIDSLSHQAIVKRVEYVREEADTIRREMEVMDSTEEQEKFLMRQFIVNSFATMQRGVVAKYFLKEYNLKRDETMKFKERASFVFLPLLVAFLLYYVYVFNLLIGSRATNLWLIVTFIGLGQDIFLIAPLKVFVNFVVINNNVSRDVRMMCERLSMRSKLILMRTRGMMRDAGSLVQHFNPACRAARIYPALPISRLLMSLNDQDLPHPEVPHPTMLPWAYFSLGVVGLLLLPEVLTETILDISIGGITDFGLIGLDYLRRSSVLALVLLIVFIVLAVVAVTVLTNRNAVREMFTNQPVEIKIPTDIPLEEEGSRRIKPGGRTKGPAKYFAMDNNTSEKESIEKETNELFAAAGGMDGLNEFGQSEREEFGSIWGMKKNKSYRGDADIAEPAWESNNSDNNNHNNNSHYHTARSGLDMQIPDTRHIKPQPKQVITITNNVEDLELESMENSPVSRRRPEGERGGQSAKVSPAPHFVDVSMDGPDTHSSRPQLESVAASVHAAPINGDVDEDEV